MAHTLQKIICSRFFSEWKGHPVPDLSTFQSRAVELRPNKPIVYLVGDSSLDNKAWVTSSPPSGVNIPEIYVDLMDHPRPKPDVAFWLNHVLGDRATVVNAAVEASLLRERDEGLLEHDEFVRDNIRENDILIVSVGANDVALQPTKSTMLNMAQLAVLPRALIDSGYAPALRHFKHMFGDQTKKYVDRMISKHKPKAVIICMIYFPLEEGQSSWADASLKALGYDRWPGQLQAAIKQMYKQATQKIQISGTTVLPCALYEVLDGKNVRDYTSRVEPNTEGGRKMAIKFEELTKPFLSTQEADSTKQEL
ncbi:hypothetical protein GQ43DRAFT_303029 [Delitschia confertaspora ATCC 74209]|uniref:Uncharacterized protein n=1 Tax=Delitschia confertaspora ATCC 74209 TaxID=1513339 RepID=A0A9P4JU91_9PLEO|nr:hypothetical protein GQ43DRAFT_303029 [Delitschia confertaspora ATCC 74209]